MPRLIDCANACGNKVRAAETTTGLCRECYDAATQVEPELSAPEQVAYDRERKKLAIELANLKKRYNESLAIIDKQSEMLDMGRVLSSGLDTFVIEPKQGQGTSEGTPVIVASDWHIEEKVGAEVGGLNYFNLDIAQARMVQFFQSALRLVQLLNKDIHIETVVLALLGDFITNDIHGAENAEQNALLPTHAIVMAQNHIISGIQFLLDNSTYNFVIPCHMGNHGRTTMTTRFGTENGHSLEYLMYVLIANHFRENPRVKVLIPEGMHSYLNIYGTVIRFHHGHALKYMGGVGGLYIPTNKAIAQWNKARHADLDVFGHFHQLRDGGSFICNGSLIGYNAYALSIKADFELPKQALFLMDKKRGRTCTWPILVQ